MQQEFGKKAKPTTLLHLVGAAFSLGVLFGLIEGIIQWIRFQNGMPEPMSNEILWAAPIFYGAVAGIFALISGMLYSIAGRLLHHPTTKLTFLPIVDIILFFGFNNTISLIVSINPISSWLLSIGLVVAVHRFFVKLKSSAVIRLSKFTLYFAAAVFSLYLIVTFGEKIHEKLILDRLPAARNNSPNVILITLDTLRADHLSSYGYSRPTPNLDQFAKEGIQFDYALATASWTLPSHATIMTGLYSHEHQAEYLTGNKLDDRFVTLAEAFANNGYITAAFVANTIVCSANSGLNQGFSTYNDIFWEIEDIPPWTNWGSKLTKLIRTNSYFKFKYLGRKNAEEVNEEFFSWINPGKSRPFFVWLNYFDPHDPYQVPNGFPIKYGTIQFNGNPGSFGEIGASAWGGVLSPKELEMQINSYDSSIFYLDHQLGNLFNYLKEYNLYDNSIIVITSDHGEAFGEHGLYGHKNSLYRNALHVPLLIHTPLSKSAGNHVSKTVSLIDLPNTISSIAQLSLTQPFPGRNLLIPNFTESLLIAELFHNPYHPSNQPVSQGNLTSFTTSHWHAILTGNTWELFAFGDIADKVDLVETLAGGSVINYLKNSVQIR